MIYVQDLDASHVTSTYKLIHEIIFTLPSYSRGAREQQITAYTIDRLCKDYISTKSRKTVIAIDTNFNEVVGFLFGYIEQFTECTMFYGEWTGVTNKYRNNLVMQQMWDYTENFCILNSIDGFIVDTLTTNIKMHKFLQKNGMNIWKEIKNHWYGHDYFLMGKFYGKPNGQL